MQQVFPTVRQVLKQENIPVALTTNKQDSAKFYKGLIKNELLMTWSNLFLDDFNQRS